MDGGQQADGSVGSASFEVVQALVDQGREALPDPARIAVQIWADPPTFVPEKQGVFAIALMLKIRY